MRKPQFAVNQFGNPCAREGDNWQGWEVSKLPDGKFGVSQWDADTDEESVYGVWTAAQVLSYYPELTDWIHEV